MLLPVFDKSVEKSPYYRVAAKHGCRGYIVLNRMFMPYWFGDPVEEYWAIVNDVTLWDVATERQVEVRGADAAAFVDIVVPRNLENCRVGHCRYVVVTDENGGIVNDPVLARIDEDCYWFSAADSDLLLWMKGVALHAGMDVTIRDPGVAPVQVQGAKSREVMQALFGDDILDLRYYRCTEADLDGIPLVVTRSGWTGGLGYELYLRDIDQAETLWERVLEAGRPYNIRVTGPNTIRRVEAGIMALHSDFTQNDNPFEAGFERLVDLDKPADFIGKEALRRIRAEGIRKRVIGLEFERIPSTHIEDGSAVFGPVTGKWPVRADGEVTGFVTTALHSPRLEKNIGYAHVAAAHSAPGTELSVDTGDGTTRAVVVPMPFYDEKKSIARA